MAWQPGITLEQLEKQTIYEALKWFQGNKLQTAAALGIAARTLYNKLEVYEEESKKMQVEEVKYKEEHQKQLDRMRGIHHVGVELERKAEAVHNEAGGAGGLESAVKVTEKQSVPVRVGQKVQKVSSR